MNVSPTASTANGSGLPFFNDAVTTAQQIKATAGQIYLLDLVNSAAATSYLQIFFQPVAGVVLGTTVPDLVIRLATNAVAPQKTIPFPVPIGGFTVAAKPGTGLSVAGTTTPTGATTVTISVAAVYR